MDVGRREKSRSSDLKIKLIAIVCFVCITTNLKAQQGCYIASLNLIYTDRVPLTNIFLFSSAANTVCPVGSTPLTPVLIPSPTGSSSCFVLVSVGGTVLGTGVIRNYTTSYCPLDDYLPLLIAPIALVAIFRLRRKQDANKTYKFLKEKAIESKRECRSPLVVVHSVKRPTNKNLKLKKLSKDEYTTVSAIDKGINNWISKQ